MTDKTSRNWEEIGKGAAAEIKIKPKKLKYIEARGLLCHELLYLLGGQIEFVKTSWRQCVLKILEFKFPISPICRWYPSEDCVLEWIGYNSQWNETKVYRLTPREGSITVFFVEYKPEPPAAGGYVRPFFNVPQLHISNFLRPPFDESNDNTKIEQLLRAGLFDEVSDKLRLKLQRRAGLPVESKPISLTSGAENRMGEIHRASCKGLWEGLSKQ